MIPPPLPTAPASPTPIWIHADESCLGNQFTDRDSPGGAAGVVERWDGSGWVRRDYWISEPATTNNRMALRSAIEALRGMGPSARRSGVPGAFAHDAPLRFVSDSQYLVKGMSEWLPGWKERGWTRKAGPIENLELWMELDAVAAGRTVRWEWVRGHAGHPKNEYANDLAVRAAKEQDQSSGLVESGFAEWLRGQRAKGRYLDFKENAAL